MPLDPETALAAMDLRLFCRYMAGLRAVLRDPAEHTALAPEALQRVQRLVGAWRAYILPFVRPSSGGVCYGLAVYCVGAACLMLSRTFPN